MIGYGLDRGRPKDSETAPNSFLTKINGNVFWRFAPDMDYPFTFFTVITGKRHIPKNVQKSVYYSTKQAQYN